MKKPDIVPARRPWRLSLLPALALAFFAPLTTAAHSDTRSAVPATPDTSTIVHTLNRLGFGATPQDVERVRARGLARYIEEQLHPERLRNDALDRRLARFATLTLDSRTIAQRYYLPAIEARRESQRAPSATLAMPGDEAASMSGNQRQAPSPADRRATAQARLPLIELSGQKVLRAAYSAAQLEEVLVDFWFNHFNVFAGKGATRNYLTEYERDVIRRHVLGRFRDLLGAVAKSPAMLFYLDNWLSAGETSRFTTRARRRQSANSGAGPPRGLNENYGRELLELHTLGVDGGYTQEDVVAVARAFTGWTIANPRQGGAFRFDPRRHDNGEKVVLGRRLAGGGQDEGERVLDLVASHPATATHIATKLARRFVADDPPPALIDRVASVFRDTRGDLRAVTRAVITSPEFFAAEARHAKIKSPFEFLVSALRVTGATVERPERLVGSLRELGQPLYLAQPPSGYDDVKDAWVSSGALLNRMNFAAGLTSNRIPGVRVDLRSTIRTQSPNAAHEALERVLFGDVSAATRQTLTQANDPATLLALTLGSPEFQRK